MKIDGVTWLTGPNRSLTRFGEAPLFKEGLYRLDANTYAWMVPNGSWGETNIGLIDCGGQSVLIDTCWDVRYTQELLDAAADIIQQSPIEYVLNTHADGDHCWGNQLFSNRQIIATQACIQQMHHLSPRSLNAIKKTGGMLASVRVPHLAKFGHYMHTMFSPYDFSGIHITPAHEGFSGERLLKVNGVEILLSEVGPAHTNGDAIVYIPSRRIAFAADILFVGATPVMWSGPVENLLAALKKLLALDARVIVPGHGPLATPTDVQNVIDYWEFVQEELHARMTQGMPADVAARDVVLSPAFRHSIFASWDSPERLMTNAYTLYRQWGVQLPYRPGLLGPMDLMRRQAMLAFELPQARPTIMRHFSKR